MMKLYQDRNSGFTLVEALAAAAILIILLGLSAVGVARWRDPLKITELDNAARAIYMAAENRAILLQNSGAAVSLLAVPPTPDAGDLTSSSATVTQDGKDKTVSLCVLSNATKPAILDELLPVGVIDPALREGCFYILYDRSTYHVFEVFYAEKPFSFPEDEKDMKIFRGSRSERVSYYRKDTASRCLVGHYEGGLAGKIGAKPLPTPGVEVSITNGNELTLTVKYTIPNDLPSGVKYSPSVRLNYPGAAPKQDLLSVNNSGMIIPVDGGRLIEADNFAIAKAGDTVTYTWVLDSLEQDGGGNFTKQFKGLFSAPDTIAFGGDFTVTASLGLSADGYISSFFSPNKDIQDNSLFDTTSTADTAYIANLRHLQNLDSDSSGAAGKKTAKQCADIDCGKYTYTGNDGTALVSDYEFKPIQNNELTTFDARHEETGAAGLPYSISNLTVTAGSADKKNGAGLFGSVGSAGFKFQNIRLVNTAVTTESTSSGALLGYFWSPVEFDGCQVIDAKISTSGVAGGMAGFNWDELNFGNVIFNNCTIEKLEVNSSNSYAGGLLGGRNIDKENYKGNAAVSFIDCTAKEIQITGLNYTGGLTGAVDSAASFKNCQVVNAAVKNSAGWKVATGGIAGYNATTDISFQDCKVEAITVSSLNESYAGGMLGGKGAKGTATFINCKVGTDGKTNTAISGHHAGGILGNSDAGSTAVFAICTVGMKNGNRVNITGVNYAGGLVGNSSGGALADSWIFNADITATGDYSEAGGLAGGTTKTDFKGCTVKGVAVKAGASAGGLVGNVTGGEFNNCKAIDAKAASTAWNSEAGGLAGRTSGANLTKCWVYWEDTTGMTASDYKITAITAGGLVGAIRGGGTIKESFAATLVNGSIYAGGLVGNLPKDTIEVKITESYADCCLCAGETGVDFATTGGLIGLKEDVSPKLTLENVYATGFIKGKNYVAAGLCGGWYMSETTIRNAYAAVHYDDVHTVSLPLANDIWPNNSANCYFLEPSGHWLATTYDDMSSINLGGAFGTPTETHPYNLDGKNRGTYPFPGLKGLPHYGDWPVS